jgi:hypothetical protein
MLIGDIILGIFAVGLLGFGGFAVVLKALPERKPRQVRMIEPPPPEATPTTCGCGHDIAFHNLKQGKCHGAKSGPPCGCQTYTGATPYPEFYAPELPE